MNQATMTFALPTSAAASRETAAGLEIRLFGPMEVHTPSGPLPHLRSRKGLCLLALLVLRAGRKVDRGWIAGTVWPDCDDTRGRRSLRQSLHDLRLALGSEAWRLAGDSPRTLTLDLSGAAVDASAFDAASAAGRGWTAGRPSPARSG